MKNASPVIGRGVFQRVCLAGLASRSRSVDEAERFGELDTEFVGGSGNLLRSVRERACALLATGFAPVARAGMKLLGSVSKAAAVAMRTGGIIGDGLADASAAGIVTILSTAEALSPCMVVLAGALLTLRNLAA